jgi:hypothetical protein
MSTVIRCAAPLLALFVAAACGGGAPAETAASPETVMLPAGATRATIDSELPASGHRDYVLTVAAGQLFTVFASADADLEVTVSRDGEAVPPAVSNAHYWAGYATEAGEYAVRVTGPSGTAYDVSFHKPRRVLAGGTGITAISGHAAGHGEVDYVVKAAAGDRLSAELRSDAAAAYISIVRVHDGVTLLDHGSEADAFETVADADGDYLIAVVSGAAPTEFTLMVGRGTKGDQ